MVLTVGSAMLQGSYSGIIVNGKANGAGVWSSGKIEYRGKFKEGLVSEAGNVR